MKQDIVQFGTKREGVEYIARPGVYAIATNSDGHLAVEEVDNKYFLLGGGLDVGETEEEGLRREIMEEVGKSIVSSVFLGKVNQYVDAKDGHFNKQGSFYKVELGEDASIEFESDLKWITKEEFKLKGAQEFQVWVVNSLWRD